MPAVKFNYSLRQEHRRASHLPVLIPTHSHLFFYCPTVILEVIKNENGFPIVEQGLFFYCLPQV